MSAGQSAEPQPLELDIFHLPFRLRAPIDEHERLQRAAKHVDTVMRGLVSGQPSADTVRLAIQAAFLISTDYFRTLDETFSGPEQLANKMGRRVDDILRGLDIALADMNGALGPLAEESRPRSADIVQAEGAGAGPARPDNAEAEKPPAAPDNRSV